VQSGKTDLHLPGAVADLEHGRIGLVPGGLVQGLAATSNKQIAREALRIGGPLF